MADSQIRIFENLEALSREAAKRFSELAVRGASAGRNFTCALSGGSTPRRLYELLANPEYDLPWQRVHLFQVDERTVPPDDPESNCRMIREALLSKVPIPADHFHRIAAEGADRDAAAREYAAELQRVLEPPAGEWPRLDLVFLGMGGDGHTASLFPFSPALAERKLWVSSNYSPRLGKHRLTLTYPVLNAAAEIIFLVSGENKAETLRQVLEGPPGVFPAQGISPVNGLLSWFLDKAVARLLSRAARSGA
jgi:6-phosphogluconolactonase